MMPHIAIDVRMAGDSGIGTYIRNVVPRIAVLEPEWRFTLLGDSQRLREASWARMENMSVQHVGASVYSVREQMEIPWRTPRNADLLWCPHYNAPLLPGRPLVVTIHDMAHLRLPEHVGRIARRIYARTLFRSVSRRAATIMCDSAFTRAEYRELISTTAPDPVVVHCGVDGAWFEGNDAPPLAEPYFVFVGNLKPHKNVALILKALRIAGAALRSRLVVVGRHSGMRTIDERVRRLLENLGESVSVVGEIPDALVRTYVRHARALILPSYYEGFGLPALEAMAAGTPVLVSRAGSLPEICGDAALYFDPRDAQQLASLMIRIDQEPELRTTLIEQGRAHARRFDWSSTARKTRDLLALSLRHAV